jgi:glycosyltransferase involved in cell wall biosynthesis
MHGHGRQFLTELFRTIESQTFTDFEVVVSDHSWDQDVAAICSEWKDEFPIDYLCFAENRGNASSNMNNAVKHARGEILKPMHQDDFFLEEGALALIAEAMGDGAQWGACGYAHAESFDGDRFRYRVPYYNDDMAYSHNTIGAPAVSFFRRSTGELLDEHLIWMNDAELYYRLKQKYGEPTIIPDALVCIRVWPGQVTNIAADEELRERERTYTLGKHNLPLQDRESSMEIAAVGPSLGILGKIRRRVRGLISPQVERFRRVPPRLRRFRYRHDLRDDFLTRLANAYGSDKGTRKVYRWDGDRHYYTRIYTEYFKQLRGHEITLLEVGIGAGPSLRMWYSYFPKAKIIGLDIGDHADKNNDRVMTFVADQSNRSDLRRAMQSIDCQLDVIIDDGGHYMNQQQISLGFLFPWLKSGGLYIIEDLHTSYWPSNGHYAVYDNQPIDVNLERSNTTLKMVRDFIRNGHLYSEYLTPEEIQYLNSTIKSCRLVDTVENSYGPNHLAMFRKL